MLDMQVNETLAEGLKRGLTVTIPATELDARLSDRLDQLKERVQIKGFRPGQGAGQRICAASTARRPWPRSSRALIGETTRQAISDRGERAAMQPKVAMTEDERRGDADPRGPRRSHLHARIRSAADLRARRFQGPEDRAPGRRGHRRRRSRSGCSGSARARAPMPPVEREARDGRSRDASTTSARSDGELFEWRRRRERADRARHRPASFPASRSSWSALKAGEQKTIEVTFPADYPAPASRGQAGELRRHGQGSRRSRARSCSTTSSPSALGLELIEKLRETIGKQIESEYGQRDAPEGEAADARPARRSCTPSRCRKTWSSRSSTTSGGR